MKRYHPLPLLACVAVVISTAQAAEPSADDVLAQARKALGGEQKLTSLQSIAATGTSRRTMGPGGGMRIAMGGPGEASPSDVPTITSELELSILLPDKYLRSETMPGPGGMPGPTLLEAVNGEETWNDSRSPGGNIVIMRAPGPGGEAARGRQTRAAFARLLLAWTLFPPVGVPLQYQYAGVAEAPDGKADMIDATGPDGFAARLFLDQSSHLPLMLSYKGRVQVGGPARVNVRLDGPPDPEKMKAEMAKMPPPETREAEFQLRLAEYRKAGGVQLPHLMTWSVDGKTTEEFEVKKYTINGKMSADKFKK